MANATTKASAKPGGIAMLIEIVRFEVRYQLRQPLFPIASIVFFALGVAAMSSDVGAGISEAPVLAARNSPYVICSLMAAFSIFGLFVVAAFVAGAALRDFDHDCDMLFFCRPIRRIDYFGGRFLGAMAVSTLLFVALTAGFVAGQFVPWQDATRLGPTDVWPFVFGLVVFALPNLWVMAALFFGVAIWTRRMLWTYLAVIVFITMQDAVEVVSQQESLRSIGAIIEPLGLTALQGEARYWTVAEYSEALPGLFGAILFNRAVWLGIGAVALLFSWWRFGIARSKGQGGRGKATPKRVVERPLPSVGGSTSAAPLARVGKGSSSTGAWANLRVFGAQCRFESMWAIRSPFFIVCTVFVVILAVSVAWLRCLGDGEPILPHTGVLVRTLSRTLVPFVSVMVVFYAGELTWRDRSQGLAGMLDATPAASAGFLLSRLVAIASAIVVTLVAAIFATIAVQVVRGPVPLEPWLYVKAAAIVAWPALLLAAPCLLIQALASGKFLGYLILIGLFTLRTALPILGWDSSLYLYGKSPSVLYSEMAGYGPTALPFAWFSLYWTGMAGLILWMAARAWPRGERGRIGNRIRSIFAGPVTRNGALVVAILALISASSFGVAYFNSRVVNQGLGPVDLRERWARYESTYSKYASLPMPRIASIHSEIDLDPSARRLVVHGRYQLVNGGSEPIRTVAFTVPSRWGEGIFRMDEGVDLIRLGVSEAQVVVEDHELGFHVYELRTPLASQATLEVEFEVAVKNEGFTDRRPNMQVLNNGTFFTQRTVFPSVGYVASNQLTDPRHRTKHGLGEVRQIPTIDDPKSAARSYMDADWLECETIFSTSLDQTALAAGVLVREWEEEGRRHFHYRSTAPTQGILAFASARYDVVRDRCGDVELEIYHHSEHDVNATRMMKIMKASVERFSEWFAPYPHEVLRIAEMPATNGQLAVSLASFIGFSEAFGFLSDVREGQLDTLAWVTAHEVAHQWWGHQMAPADCQGSTMLGESLAEYSALLLLEDLYDHDEVVRFRGRELDRYLTGRGREKREELPLERVENQAYVHYNKGALAFSALADRVGKESLIGELRGFLQDYRFAGPPYPRAPDLMSRLESLVTGEDRGFLDDLFRRIVLYDLQVVSAEATDRAGGGYALAVDLDVRKLIADGKGRETDESPSGTPITVEVVGDDGVLWRGTVTDGGEATLRIKLDQRPVQVVVDPDRILIDRITSDNRMEVTYRNPISAAAR